MTGKHFKKEQKAPTDKNLEATYRRQGEMLANRVQKRLKHLRKRFARQNIEVFRLYDWDIPEIRAVVDWYAGRLVIAEYTRRQSTPEFLPMMGAAVGARLGIPDSGIHLKERRAGKQDGVRYERIAKTDEKFSVCERDLKFLVNLNDYVDTGLFADHRDTRQMVREAAAGKDVLNLYCYTGAFTCYAARGGANSTVSVDRSESAIQWAAENLALNGIPQAGNTLIQSDTFDFLAEAQLAQRAFDLAVVDPPSYSTTRRTDAAFDIVQDHPALLSAVAAIMRKDGIIFFSTNHQNFTPKMTDLPVSEVTEITPLTIPEDYRSKKKDIHRCWKIVI